MALPTGSYHLPESLGLLLFGLENTVGTVTLALPGAPGQLDGGLMGVRRMNVSRLGESSLQPPPRHRPHSVIAVEFAPVSGKARVEQM